MSDSSKDAYLDYLKFFRAQAKVERESLDDSKRKAREKAKCFNAQSAAWKVTGTNVSRREITHPPDGIFTVKLSTAATGSDLKLFYEKVDERYRRIASLCLEVTLADGSKVEIPVTPKNPEKVEEDTFHVIAMECPGKGTLEILVRESDNYVIGFRVYHSLAEKASTKWCVFDEEIPRSFGQANRTRYSSTHVNIEKVEFGAGVLERIFKFFDTLQKNPRMVPSIEGQICVNALFVLFGECQRFRIHREWAIRNVRSHVIVHPTLAMRRMMLDWSSLCKVGFHLYLALLEVQFYSAYEAAYKDSKGDGYDEARNPYRTLPAAYKAVCDKEEEHAGSGMVFRSRETNKIEIGCIVGGELLLLNHDDETCDRILMRKAHYKGAWY